MWVFARPWRQIQRHSITNMIVAIILYEVLYISLCLCSKLNYQSQIFIWRNRFISKVILDNFYEVFLHFSLLVIKIKNTEKYS